MSELEPIDVPVSAIHIDLLEKSITLEGKSKAIGKLVFSSGTIIFQDLSGRPVEWANSAPAGASHADSPPDQPEPVEGLVVGSQERERAVTLTGRLKSKPREGRPDTRGNPTVWARLAVHEEGSEKAQLYSATFHRHTARIALGLNLDAAITVQGYPHFSDNPDRMPTLSVINIVSYPSKASQMESE
jgi:hypothetical protein